MDVERISNVFEMEEENIPQQNIHRPFSIYSQKQKRSILFPIFLVSLFVSIATASCEILYGFLCYSAFQRGRG
jgi:hypothetical protein